MDEKDILAVIQIQKTAMKIIIDDDELRELNAKSAKLAYDSYVAVGFAKSEAIELVSATLRSGK